MGKEAHNFKLIGNAVDFNTLCSLRYSYLNMPERILNRLCLYGFT
jgi:hypothetical protein